METRTKQLLVVAGVIGFALVIAALGLIVGKTVNSKRATAPSVTPIYLKDPATGNTYLKHNGLKPEPEVQTGGPSFSGFGIELLQQGLSQSQLSAFERAIAQYPPFAHSSTQIILDVIDLAKDRPPRTDPQQRWILSSTLAVIGQGKFNFKLYYFNLTDVELLLFDSANKQVFDSGTLTGTAS